ncbi:unnamed protein product [Closterium sp. NIES-54]
MATDSFLNNNQLTGTIPSAIFTMKKLAYIYLANNHLTGSLPAAISQLKNLEQIFISNNSLYGPLPDCLLYGRINRDFKNMLTTMGAPAHDFEYIAANDNPLVNLAHNFFFGDGVLFALGYKVCPTEINEPNNLGIRDSFAWREPGGKSDFLALNKPARVSLSGNCLTLTLNAECSVNAIQRSTAACQAFCSITDNGPCDGHGACVPDDPASPSNFTCLCDAGYTTVDSSNGSSTCAIVHSTTNTTTGNPCFVITAPHSIHMFCTKNSFHEASAKNTYITAPCPFLGSVVSIDGVSPSNPSLPFHLPHYYTTSLASFPTPHLSQFSLSTALMLASPLPSCSPLHCPHARLCSALKLCPRIYTLSLSHLWSDFFMCAEKWEGLDVCEQFTLQQMPNATNNWSEDNVLGKGGFGVVYKGHSPQGQPWAIKRSTIMTNDFETEVRAMSSLHHMHLVRLLGFCLDQNVETGKQEQILVYEFMANRDLEYHIHRTKRPLSLRQRLRLAQGTAEGLAYLHGFDTPIVHRDIKPANILVSADMQAKVADFGLLKRLTHGDADATRVAGTLGYVDPDYNRTHIITVKSDVFSFGIVLLQLLSGKSPHVDPKTHIRKWAMKLVEAYEVDELKDSKMPPVSEEAIVDIADLALDCIKSPGTRRPTMKDVAYRLSALIAKHCPDREDESENVVKEEGTSNQGMPSELCGDGGREPERSHGSQSARVTPTPSDSPHPVAFTLPPAVASCSKDPPRPSPSPTPSTVQVSLGPPSASSTPKRAQSGKWAQSTLLVGGRRIPPPDKLADPPLDVAKLPEEGDIPVHADTGSPALTKMQLREQVYLQGSGDAAEKRSEPPPSKIEALDGSNYEEWSGRMRSAFKRYKLLKIAMGEEKMPGEGDARDRWIEKSAVLYDLILQSVNNDMFQHIKDLVELDDSGPKAWKLLRDVIQPNTLPMINDTYARMAAVGSEVSQMQQCTKIISVLDNSWENLIPTLNVQQDKWTPEWLRQQIMQGDFRRRHTGGGAANKIAEGYGAAGGSRGRGGGRC